MEKIIPIASVVLAALPAIIWALIFLKKRDLNSKYYAIIFFGGTLTVFPIFAMQLAYFSLIDAYPNLDFVGALKQTEIYYIHRYNLWIILSMIWVGITEEVIKFLVLRYTDKTHPELVSTTTNAMKFGILAGLGFAFSENIKYFYETWINANKQFIEYSTLYATVIFRSVFTVCAHTMFSAILGYYYAASKFADDFINFKKWSGKNVSPKDIIRFRRTKWLKGLLLAGLLHATFNIFLTSQQVLPAILIVAAMVFILFGLMQNKLNNLVFILADRHRSVMSQRDIDVVLEYVGEKFNKKSYKEVYEICTRLLQRDPDNNVAKIFQAKALDKLQKGKD